MSIRVDTSSSGQKYAFSLGHPGAWRLQIADLEGVVCAMVACRVGGGNDAAAMSVVRRDDRLPWLLLATVEFVRVSGER